MNESTLRLGPGSELEVVELVGVPPLRFGMSPDEVKRHVHEPPHSEGRDGLFFFPPGLQVNHPGGRVDFFELSWDRESRPRVLWRGVSVFETPAEELVERISGRRPEREEFEFTDYELDLALWRPTLPSLHGPDEPEDESRNGRYWMTIAVGPGGLFRRQEEQAAAKRAARRGPP